MILHVVRLVEHGKLPICEGLLNTLAFLSCNRYGLWGSHILYGVWPFLTYHATHEFNFVKPFRKQ